MKTSWLNRFLPASKADIEKLIKQIIMTQDELAAALETVDTNLEAVGVQLTKAQGEITKQIADLKAAVGGNVTPAVSAAFDRLSKATAALTPIAQSLDDVTPDVPPTTPTPPTP